MPDHRRSLLSVVRLKENGIYSPEITAEPRVLADGAHEFWIADGEWR